MPFYDQIIPEQAALIERARLFFVASAHPDFLPGPKGEGPVNVSPKGGVPLHVIDPHTVAYLDYPGSGNETARHAQAGGPVTVMVMSMDGEDAAIVRLYGEATVEPIEQSPLADLVLASPSEHLTHPRQVITIRISCAQTSCGYGVPILEYVGERSKANRGKRYKRYDVKA